MEKSLTVANPEMNNHTAAGSGTVGALTVILSIPTELDEATISTLSRLLQVPGKLKSDH